MKRWAYTLIASAGFIWGLIGFFVEGLYAIGFSPIQIVSLRVMSAAVIMLSYLLITDRSLLKINIGDCKYFVGTGIFSFVFFNWLYFITIKETSVSVAAILLYTAPAFVTIISRVTFKESLTPKKISSLILTFTGCILVAGYFPNTDWKVSTFGILIGLLAGFGDALYSIFGKSALEKYHPLTIITYTFTFAGIALLPFSGFWNSMELFHEVEGWYYIISVGLFPTALAYILYTKGLSYVESSKAAITATVEPVVATIVGVLILGEILTYWQMAGVILVLGAVIMVQERE